MPIRRRRGRKSARTNFVLFSVDSAAAENFEESPRNIENSLSFELLKTDSDNNSITDANKDRNKGQYIDAIDELEYVEYAKTGEVTYSYSPGARLDLTAERTLFQGKDVILYTVNVPLSNDTKAASNVNAFPSDLFLSYEGVSSLFQFIVEVSNIPRGKVNSAINNLDFIVDRDILLLSNDTIVGSDSNDYFQEIAGNDLLQGLAGNDTLLGGSGDDTLEGGSGNDYLYGNQGNDSLLGGAGNDLLLGGNKNDSLTGDEGNDTLLGGSGNDTLTGNEGDDYLRGNRGNDSLLGGAGNDTLVGYGRKTEFDILTGNSGADVFVLGNFSKIFYRGAGHATITDYDRNLDTIRVSGNSNRYTLNVFGSNTQISYNKDLIAIVEGTDDVVLTGTADFTALL